MHSVAGCFTPRISTLRAFAADRDHLAILILQYQHIAAHVGSAPRYELLTTQACSLSDQMAKIGWVIGWYRTPRFRPSLTAISRPQSFEYSRQAECNDSSSSPEMPRSLSVLRSRACSATYLWTPHTLIKSRRFLNRVVSKTSAPTSEES